MSNKLSDWIDNKTSSLLRLKDREQEDWEKVWPREQSPTEIITQLRHLLKGRYRLLTYSTGLEVIKAATTAGAMITLKKSLEPFETDNWDNVIWILLAFLALNMIQLLSDFGKNFILTRLRTDLLCEVRGRLYNKLLYFPVKFYHRLEVGSILNHVSKDTGLVVDLVTVFLLSAVATVLTAVFVGIVVFTLSWEVGLIVFVLLAFGIPVIQLLKGRVGKYAKRIFTLHSRMLSILQQSLYAIKYIKAIGFERYESDRINRILEENRRLDMKVAATYMSLGPIMEFLYMLLISFGLCLGLLFFEESIKLSLIAPLVYALVRLSNPTQNFFKSILRLEEHLQAAQRIFKTLTTTSRLVEKKDGIHLQKPVLSIKLQQVSFGYENNQAVLKGIDLELKRGEMLAIMGESGAGKSTLCELLMGLDMEYKGKILINDIELRQLDTASFRSTLGLVPQEPLLIRGTIRENLLYGYDREINEADLIDALKRAHAWEFVRHLHMGLDSELSERGVNLSGGERQRICLARALLRDPEILILDEATSSLDRENEANIMETLKEIKNNIIVLVISHRYSVCKYTDRLFLLREGNIKELRPEDLDFSDHKINT